MKDFAIITLLLGAMAIFVFGWLYLFQKLITYTPEENRPGVELQLGGEQDK